MNENEKKIEVSFFVPLECLMSSIVTCDDKRFIFSHWNFRIHDLVLVKWF